MSDEQRAPDSIAAGQPRRASEVFAEFEKDPAYREAQRQVAAEDVDDVEITCEDMGKYTRVNMDFEEVVSRLKRASKELRKAPAYGTGRPAASIAGTIPPRRCAHCDAPRDHKWHDQDAFEFDHDFQVPPLKTCAPCGHPIHADWCFFCEAEGRCCSPRPEATIEDIANQLYIERAGRIDVEADYSGALEQIKKLRSGGAYGSALDTGEQAIMSYQLDPCPFCGAELSEESCVDANEGVGYTPMYSIWCPKCSASTASYRDMDDAYAAWNSRRPRSTLGARVEDIHGLCPGGPIPEGATCAVCNMSWQTFEQLRAMVILYPTATAACEKWHQLLHEVAISGVESDDARIDYVTVQIDRELWNELQFPPRRHPAFEAGGK